MIIKCNIGGTLSLANLNLSLTGGQVVDLHTLFKPSDVKREMTPPNGCLYQAFKEGWLVHVAYDSTEYKEYQKKLNEETERRIKEQIKENAKKLLINYHKKASTGKIEFIRSLGYAYYDFLIEIKNSETDENLIYEIHKKLGEFAERKVEEGFILII